MVVVLGLLDEAFEGLDLGLVILPLVLLIPEVIHEGSDYIFCDILLIALDLRSIPAQLASEQHQLLVLVGLSRLGRFLLAVVLDGMREECSREVRVIVYEKIVSEGDCMMRELYLEDLGDEVGMCL